MFLATSLEGLPCSVQHLEYDYPSGVSEQFCEAGQLQTRTTSLDWAMHLWRRLCIRPEAPASGSTLERYRTFHCPNLARLEMHSIFASLPYDSFTCDRHLRLLHESQIQRYKVGRSDVHRLWGKLEAILTCQAVIRLPSTIFSQGCVRTSEYPAVRRRTVRMGGLLHGVDYRYMPAVL
jgi:hypothetical protein